VTNYRWAIGLCLLIAGLGTSTPRDARAQEWSVDVSAGQTVFGPVSANVGTSNLIGTLRYDARRGTWVYGAAAAPLRSDNPVWGAFGTGGRLTLAGSGRGPALFGIDVGGHGFVFRDPVADLGGTGATVEALPFVSLGTTAARVELRGGWRGHALSFAGTTGNRGVAEAGARVTYGTTFRVMADTRWVRASEGSYPFVGASLLYGGSPAQVWAHAGRWVGTNLDDVAWGGGAAYALSHRVNFWASVRQEVPDPLYWNTARRTWSTGVTTRFGRPAARPLSAVSTPAGRVVIRLPVADAPGPELWIAGSFNSWQPVRMQREGRDWVFRAPLRAGMYRYAFRSADGSWFVPASVTGRRDDGMGGHVAVLVVE
jgi:hypothetical protein